jgi:hypothetical protein
MNLYENIYGTTDKILDECVNVLNETKNGNVKIVQNKKTRRRILLTRCELICAKEHNDPLFLKYKKATKIRKKARKMIHEKYETPAKAKLMQYLKNRNK